MLVADQHHIVERNINPVGQRPTGAELMIQKIKLTNFFSAGMFAEGPSFRIPANEMNLLIKGVSSRVRNLIRATIF